MVAVDGDFADWKLLLLCLAQPWPSPSRSEIIQMLVRFRDMDQRKLGSLSRPQFNRIELWFTGSPIESAFGMNDMTTLNRPPSASDVTWQFGYLETSENNETSKMPHLDSRRQQFRDLLFELFSEQPQTGDNVPLHMQQPRIDYVTMLSYVARVPDGMESLLRMVALALADHITSVNTANSGKSTGSQESSRTDIISQAADASREGLRVPIEPLFRVLSTYIRMRASHSRVGDASAKEERMLKEKLQSVYASIQGHRNTDPFVPLSVLLKHPALEEIMIAAANNFRSPVLRISSLKHFIKNCFFQNPQAVFRLFQDVEKE